MRSLRCEAILIGIRRFTYSIEVIAGCGDNIIERPFA
jgi:hypothetical protein